MIVAYRLAITGRVQGVGFRAFVTWHAQSLRLRGWVRNRRDGSVEALLIGEKDAVGTVIEECQRGPQSARVDGVEKLPATDDGTRDFTERPTV
jgi:acylphosphatase